MEQISNIIMNIRLLDILDISLITFILYKVLLLIRNTRAEQLLKGIIAIFAFAKICDSLQLYTISWILQRTILASFFAVAVVFQPELRRIVEYVGRSNILKKSLIDMRGEKIDHTVIELVHALASLSRQKIGALVIIERQTGLNEIVETGTTLDADVSSELMINIFIPNTPLHDGAVIIKGDKIKAAACFLPLSDNPSISKELGTRHRAALGVSERSDALALIVSEETGGISIAEKGEIRRYLDEDTLKQILKEVYVKEDRDFFAALRSNEDE